MKKVLSCILSFLPAIGFIGVIIGLIHAAPFMNHPVNEEQKMISIMMVVIALAVVILTFAVMVWYMIKACKNPQYDTGMKVLWCFMLYMFNMFAFPVFWFVHVRKE